MSDQPTLRWLRNRAYTVLAELMTSDDDRVALRAAQTVIDLLDKQESGLRIASEGSDVCTTYIAGATSFTQVQRDLAIGAHIGES